MAIKGPTDAVAWFAAAAVVELAGRLAEREILDDGSIRHLHSLLAVARKHIEASGDRDFEATLLVLEQRLPVPSPDPGQTDAGEMD